MLRNDPDATGFVIAAGILGSLIASALMLIATEIVLGPRRDDNLEAAERLDEGLVALRDTAALVAGAADHGIRAIKPKSDYTRAEWISVLDDAEEGLTLVGHALDKWCQEDIREHFDRAIERLANAGKPVQLVTLPPYGPNTDRIGDQRRKDYGSRVRDTLDVVDGIYARLSKESRESLSVRTLRGAVDMPYMLVANEKVVITCAYPTVSQSSDLMLTSKVRPDSPIGHFMREDVRQLVASRTEQVTFPLTSR